MLLLLVKYSETIIIKNSNIKKSENTKGTTLRVLYKHLKKVKITMKLQNLVFFVKLIILKLV